MDSSVDERNNVTRMKIKTKSRISSYYIVETTRLPNALPFTVFNKTLRNVNLRSSKMACIIMRIIMKSTEHINC